MNLNDDEQKYIINFLYFIFREKRDNSNSKNKKKIKNKIILHYNFFVSVR